LEFDQDDSSQAKQLALFTIATLGIGQWNAEYLEEMVEPGTASEDGFFIAAQSFN
jgi:hypothetical protein